MYENLTKIIDPVACTDGAHCPSPRTIPILCHSGLAR